MGKSIIKQISTRCLQDICNGSSSFAEVLRKLGLCGSGQGINVLKTRIKDDNVDLSVMKVNGKKNKRRVKTSLEEIMVENSTFSRNHLKHKIIKAKILEEVCEECGIKTEWNGKSLVLVLDHINGVNNDHRLTNLRMLCPNCNSQQSTFAGRNVKKKNPQFKICKGCGDLFEKTSHEKTYCSLKCFHTDPESLFKKRKVKNRPEKIVLEEMIDTMSWCAIGRKYEVSDNTIRKWAKSYGIEWNKRKKTKLDT